MKRSWIVLTFVVASAVALVGQAKPTKPLEIYVVDPEGGKEALWVTPAGQAILIDTGSPGGRDTDRIMEAINAAGVKKIDVMLSTHYHVDHVGGLQELVKRIPIDHFYDHGETIETGVNGAQKEQVPGFWAWYVPYVSKVPHTVLKPGDRIPVTGLDWHIVTSAGKVLKTPLPGAGKPNPLCAGTERRTVTQDPEDGQSVLGSRGPRLIRQILSTGGTLFPVAAGIGLIAGRAEALYLLVPAAIGCLYLSIGNAWVFAVEIPRRKQRDLG